ncbi:MAG: hypothetical protein KC561_18135, partial [Myxococcales bacterium]|nr:hypothetical protein [Myxococcales bacterium]
MTRQQLEIHLGANWKLNDQCLTRLYSYSEGDDSFDFTHITDIIDIVVDGSNLTSRLPEDSIFNVMHELTSGLVHLAENRFDKHILTFRESNWELAIQHAGDGEVELSVYTSGASDDVAAHNLRVRWANLASVVCYVAESMLSDLISVNAALAHEAQVRELGQAVHALRARSSSHHQPPSNPREMPSDLTAVRRAVGCKRLTLELRFDPRHRDLWRYPGTPDADHHSLLFRGSMVFSYWGRERIVADGAYLFPTLTGLLDGNQRLLELLDAGTGSVVLLSGFDARTGLITAQLHDPDTIQL